MLPGETNRKESIGNLHPFITSFTFGHVQMGVFSSISKLKALILVFQSPGHSQVSVPKQLVENRHHPRSPAASEGLSPHTECLCLGGVIFRVPGAGAGSAAVVPLQVFCSHFWALFLLQPPAEGRLGSANASPRGDTL